MDYLDDYVKLWQGVIQNDNRNGLFGDGLTGRERNVELIYTRTNKSNTDTIFNFHGLSEDAYLESFEDPKFLETLHKFGFCYESLHSLVKEFRNYSGTSKLVRNVFSRSKIGPFFGVGGIYSIKIAHRDADKIEEANKELLRRKGDEMRRSGKNLASIFKECMDTVKIAPEILSCYERYLSSWKPYGQIAVLGLGIKGANEIYRKFIETIESKTK